MSNIDVMDRDRSRLDEFAKSEPRQASPGIVPMSSAIDRVFGAQAVAVHRDENRILQKLKTLAAAAGAEWYYRFPVKKKGGGTDFIEGASIKLANDVARIFGNCDVDCRATDLGDSWLFYARFTDLETGFSLTRPFQQRKSQGSIKGDADRQLDIAFQIGTSKAIRNVVVNALQTFADFAFEEARNSLVDKIGKELDKYRTRTIEGISNLKIDIARVEAVIGRPVKDWLAPDVARVIAMGKAINDGMATIDETFPKIGDDAGHDPETGEVRENNDLNKFAEKNSGASDSGTGASEADAESERSGTAESASHSRNEAGNPGPDATTGQAASDSKPSQVKEKGAAKAAGDKTASKDEAMVPTSEATYMAHANAWISKADDAEAAEKQWSAEKGMRNKCNVSGEVREQLQANLAKKIAEIKDADRS